MAAQLEGSALVILDDSDATAYLTSLGNSMQASSAPCPQQFKYRFVADPTPNAFAAPGGHVYVTSGLLASIETESELAAIVGHEVNHVVNRHGVRGLIRGQMITGAAMLAARASDDDSEDTAGAIGALHQVVTLSFGRDMEREADDTGVTAAYFAGFDPNGAISVFQKFEAMEAAQGLSPNDSMFRSHPLASERVQNARMKVALLQPSGSMRTDSEEFHSVKARIAKLAAIAPPPKEPMQAGSAWCGIMPSVTLPPGGLEAFGFQSAAYTPQYRQNYSATVEEEDEEDWEDDEEGDEMEDDTEYYDDEEEE